MNVAAVIVKPHLHSPSRARQGLFCFRAVVLLQRKTRLVSTRCSKLLRLFAGHWSEQQRMRVQEADTAN